MKKYFMLAMMAFAAIFTAVGFAACSSDDDNNTPAAPKVTEVKVRIGINYLQEPFSIAKAFNLYTYDVTEDGKAFYYAHDGHVNMEAESFSINIKDKDGKDVKLKCYSYPDMGIATCKKFPATYTFTVYAKMWIDLDKDIAEGDVHDFFLSPYFLVHTNLDKADKYTSVIPEDNPGYTYISQYNFMDIKNDHSKRADLEGKYICTLNIDKDGKCTATYKKENLSAEELK